MEESSPFHRPSKRNVTQKDVANRAGVSTSIVSYVINNGPRSVSMETRGRVLRAIEELDYRPNIHARLLTRHRTGNDAALRQFGVIMGGDPSMLTRPYYGAVLSGVYAEAHRLQLRVRFVQFLDDLNDPLLFNELIHPDEISGLLLFSHDADYPHDPALAATREANVQKIVDRVDNVICLERQWRELPAVVFDRKEAAHIAVSHLVSLGHKQIGYLGGHDDRLVGYKNGLHEHELEIEPEWISAPRGRNQSEDGYRQALQIFENATSMNGHRPTAFFACSDEVALGAMAAIDDLGLDVPQDIAIVGVDNHESAEHYRPSLTSVSVPKAQMGGYAVRMLHDRNVRPSDPAVSVVLPIRLIVRESCGAKRQNHSSGNE